VAHRPSVRVAPGELFAGKCDVVASAVLLVPVKVTAHRAFNEPRQPVSSPNVQLPSGVRLSEVERQLLAAGWLSPPEYAVVNDTGRVVPALRT